MNSQVLDEILSCQSLPSLPTVAVRVIELTSNPDVSMDELARTIQTDQGLAAKVLRTVNSSFYGLRQQCSTIQKALVMLGLSPIKTLALGFSLVSSLSENEQSDQFDQVEYWRRALYTAVAARSFAEAARLLCADEAFLGGLLQDVGQMAMLAALQNRYLELLQRAEGDHGAIVKLELEEFELQHADVGAMLAERWRLPLELVVPIKYHERPTAAPGEYAQIVRAVGIGRLAHEVLTVEQPAAALRRLYSRSEQWFGLSGPDVDDVMKRVGEAVRELKGVFNLDTGPFADVQEVLEQAEQQMAELARTEPAMPGPGLENLVIGNDEIDPLTGALGRAAFTRAVSEGLAHTADSNGEMSVVGIRIDAVQHIVEQHGQDAVDEVYLGIMTKLRRHFEPAGGLVCRPGHDLFAIVSPVTGRAGMLPVCEAFRADVEQTNWTYNDASLRVTSSIGVAGVDESTRSTFQRGDHLVAAAFRAVQAAATSGSNCVRAFTPKKAA